MAIFFEISLKNTLKQDQIRENHGNSFLATIYYPIPLQRIEQELNRYLGNGKWEL